MDAVEGADREHAAMMSRAQVMQAPNEFHRGRTLSPSRRGGHYRGRTASSLR
jgi:hypothetical protein